MIFDFLQRAREKREAFFCAVPFAPTHSFRRRFIVPRVYRLFVNLDFSVADREQGVGDRADAVKGFSSLFFFVWPGFFPRK